MRPDMMARDLLMSISRTSWGGDRQPSYSRAMRCSAAKRGTPL